MFSSTLALGLLAIVSSVNAAGPAAVPLGTAANYVILAKAGIANVATSRIVGDIGVSPITSSALTGFVPIIDISGSFATSSQVTGRLYASNYATPTPGALTTAIGFVESAYTNAAGRPSPNFLNLNTGSLGGLTLAPGLYKWSTAVVAASTVTLSGTSTDTWIFQISGTLSQSTNQRIVLTGGALPRNIVWVVAGQVTISSGATFIGTVLAQTGVSIGTGATVRGRIFAQTSVSITQATLITAA